MHTPEEIAIQLRADKNLDPAIANALAFLVKAAYRDLSQNDGELKQDSSRYVINSKSIA
ncbi:hypothetical protein [Nostoc sp. T09]|uniref:hypothetical protein n=1 Tax=Nostoc sp. T09 TaxID=1932621 RepID=UPI001C4FF9B0|nr:hypothetical protein [Nostoc sp. T09]